MTHRYDALRHGPGRAPMRREGKPPEKPSQRRARLRRRAMIVIGGVLVLITLATGIYLGYLANSFDTKSDKIPDAFPVESLRPPSRNGASNFLLLGGDKHEASGGDLKNDSSQHRADTVLLLHLPADGKKVFLISITRDLEVPIPGHDPAKITSAISTGGVSLLVRTIETILEQRVDHVALVDFQGFKGLIDSLGGISADVPTGYTSTILENHRFNQGTQEMDGETALAFVRERKAFANADPQRAKNQQAVLEGIMNEVVKPSTLANPVKVSELVSSFSPFIDVDNGFDSGAIASLALKIKDVNPDEVVSLALPAKTTTSDGLSSTVLDESAVKELAAAMAADRLTEFAEERGLDQQK